jgi:hypothetical protein
MAIILGYFAYAVGSGAEGALSFGYWVGHPSRWISWAIFGAIFGALAFYVRMLLTDTEQN